MAWQESPSIHLFFSRWTAVTMMFSHPTEIWRLCQTSSPFVKSSVILLRNSGSMRLAMRASVPSPKVQKGRTAVRVVHPAR